MVGKGKGWHNESHYHSLARMTGASGKPNYVGIVHKGKLMKADKELTRKLMEARRAIEVEEKRKEMLKEMRRLEPNMKKIQELSDELKQKQYENVIKKEIAKTYEEVTGRPMLNIEERSLEEMRTVLRNAREDADRVKEMSKPLTPSDLSGFTGTEKYHVDYLGIQLTDGVAYLRDKAEAGWLISDIATVVKMNPYVKGEEFVSIKLDVKDGNAQINYENGNGQKLFSQKYKYTDFPEGKWNLYYTNGVLELPSEN